MNSSIELEKIIDEVKQIPENRLPEVYTLLHYFRLGLEKSREPMKPLMQFAGAWREMPDEEFAELVRRS